MKKLDLKKLALMGITGGVMCASSASSAIDLNTTSGQMLAAGCGGKQGCGHTAYQPHGCGAQPQVYYYNGAQPNSSCGAAPRPANGQYAPSSSCGAAPRPANGQYAPSSACGATPRAANGQNVPSSSCGAAPRPANGQYAPSSSCGAAPKPANGQGYYSDNNYQSRPENNSPKAYGQWETNKLADSGKNSSNNGKQQGQLSEGQLLSQLNDQSKMIFMGLDAEGKALALKLANQTCKGQNDCKGLNSCKSNENTCAGKGSCKGQSPGPFKDKNVAVDVAAKKMAEKRAKANSPKY